MGEMRVSVEGLEAWSAQCGIVAGKLAVVPVGGAVPSGQATATAVSTGQSLIGGIAAGMAARARATGTSATEAATAYALNDAESATQLAAVAPASGGVDA